MEFQKEKRRRIGQKIVLGGSEVDVVVKKQ
jgi:hypothetical protein